MSKIASGNSYIGATFWNYDEDLPVSPDESRGLVLDALAVAVLGFVNDEGRAPEPDELVCLLITGSKEPFCGKSNYAVFVSPSMLNENNIGFAWVDDDNIWLLGYVELNSTGNGLVKNCYEHLHDLTDRSAADHSFIQKMAMRTLYFSFDYEDDADRPDNRALLRVGYTRDDFDKKTAEDVLPHVQY